VSAGRPVLPLGLEWWLGVCSVSSARALIREVATPSDGRVKARCHSEEPESPEHED
jgi:hypothetical protein